MSNCTTLITFMLEAPSDVFSVEIFGSWDNFQRSYQLSRDKRSGAGQWRGCHRFENITCDGDLSDTSVQREGALKMGGTYWYYYRLNGDTDHHDSAEPSTTLCPSLPGQTVNILEVPVQAEGSEPSTPNGSTTSLDSLVFTLDPKDKYVPLGVRRAATTSAVRQRKARLHRVAGTETRSRPEQSDGTHDNSQTATSNEAEGLTLRRPHSFQSVFNKLRKTKSANSSLRTSANSRTGTTSWSRKLFSRSDQSKKGKCVEDDVPGVPKLPDNVLSLTPLASVRGSPSPIQTILAPRRHHRHSSRSSITPAEAAIIPTPELPCPKQISSTLIPSAREDAIPASRPKSSRGSKSSHSTSFFTPTEPQCEPSPILRSIELPLGGVAGSNNRRFACHETSEDDSATTAAAFSQCGKHADSADLLTHYRISAHDADEPHHSYAVSSSFSYGTSDNFSPCLASNTTVSGNMSPIHLSQPETPQMSGLGDDALAWPHDSDTDMESGYPPRSGDQDWVRPPSRPSPPSPPSPAPPGNEPAAGWPGLEDFQGYSLPLDDQASAVTIKKLPSLNFEFTDRGLCHRASKQHLVQSWDDGSGHRMNALKALVDDLGYLGKLIN
ncbi:MAG: hypothetical protein Q9217_001282 [Psora testacea]